MRHSVGVQRSLIREEFVMRAMVRVALLGAVIVGALAGVGRSAPGAEAAGPGTWTYAASLPVQLAEHEATLLRNGDVLVTGGAAGAVWSDDVYVYDRSSNSGRRRPQCSARACYTRRHYCAMGGFSCPGAGYQTARRRPEIR